MGQLHSTAKPCKKTTALIKPPHPPHPPQVEKPSPAETESLLFRTEKGLKLTRGKVQAIGRCCGPDGCESLIIPPKVGALEPGALTHSLTALLGAAEASGWPRAWPARTGHCPPQRPGREPTGSRQRREQGTMSTEQAWHRQRKGLLPHESRHSRVPPVPAQAPTAGREVPSCLAVSHAMPSCPLL